METVTRELWVSLTEDELDQRRRILPDLLQAKIELEQEAKASAASYKLRIKEKNDAGVALTEVIRGRREKRNVVCTWINRPTHDELVREDTLEVVETRVSSSAQVLARRQLELPLKEGDKSETPTSTTPALPEAGTDAALNRREAIRSSLLSTLEGLGGRGGPQALLDAAIASADQGLLVHPTAEELQAVLDTMVANGVLARAGADYALPSVTLSPENLCTAFKGYATRTVGQLAAELASDPRDVQQLLQPLVERGLVEYVKNHAKGLENLTYRLGELREVLLTFLRGQPDTTFAAVCEAASPAWKASEVQGALDRLEAQGVVVVEVNNDGGRLHFGDSTPLETPAANANEPASGLHPQPPPKGGKRRNTKPGKVKQKAPAAKASKGRRKAAAAVAEVPWSEAFDLVSRRFVAARGLRLSPGTIAVTTGLSSDQIEAVLRLLMQCETITSDDHGGYLPMPYVNVRTFGQEAAQRARDKVVEMLETNEGVTAEKVATWLDTTEGLASVVLLALQAHGRARCVAGEWLPVGAEAETTAKKAAAELAMQPALTLPPELLAALDLEIERRAQRRADEICAQRVAAGLYTVANDAQDEALAREYGLARASSGGSR